MSPALEHGDYFFVDKATYHRGDPRRGDIVVFDYPRDPRRTFVMRVVGLPGERILLQGRDVVVNGAVLPEPYVAFAMTDAPACGYQYGCSETVVPADSYFVLGDNRDNARDSRVWGFVARGAIRGRASVIYWSWDSAQHSLRMRRIARTLVAS